MGAEGVRRRCDAVCTASTISQAKGQGFKSTETKHHVYGFLWKVDSFYRLFSYYLFIFIYLLLIFLRRSKEAVGLRGVIHRGEEKIMTFTDVLGKIDNFVWGVPLIVLIMGTGIFLTCRLGVLQFRRLGKALKYMVKNEADGIGEVSSFGALCTALSVQEISLVLQLLLCWADRELYSGWCWLHASVWRPNMRKACWL